MHGHPVDVALVFGDIDPLDREIGRQGERVGAGRGATGEAEHRQSEQRQGQPNAARIWSDGKALAG